MISTTGNRIDLEIRRQNKLAQAIAKSQIQIATGKRLQKASDDHASSARVSAIDRAQANDHVWASILDHGLSLSAQAESVVRNMSDILARANELVLGAASGSASAADRQTIAIELSSIAEQIDTFAATRNSFGDPLFSASSALKFRFSEDETWAPVPAAADVFMNGGLSLSQVIRDAATAVSSGNSTSINAALAATGDAIDHTADVAAVIGMRGARMERLREGIAEHKIALATERSGLEDSDLSELIATLNSQTLTLEAAQAAFARISRRSLMDILG
jgi:flagellar hook-associated protein 3 FlgL